MANTGDARTVQLKRVRLSFTESLKDKKAATHDAEPKHGCNIIIESVGDDSAAISQAEKSKEKCLVAIIAACEQQWGKPDRWKTIQEDNPKRIAFRKGERFRNDDGEVYTGYAGNSIVSASGPRAGRVRPKLYDRHKREVAEADILDVFYGGTYADVILSFYGGDAGGAGVFCSIEAIRSHQEGARIGGGGWTGSVDEFDDMEGDEDAFSGTNSSEDSVLG